MNRHATTPRAIWLGLFATVLLTAGVSSASARAGSRWVRFHGYALSVPSSWPVFDLARHPSTCVRFNRHALYLGMPGERQRCPARAVGRTEAIVLAPLTAGAATSGAGRGVAPGDLGSAARYVVRSARVMVTATWGHQRPLLSRILRRRLRSAPMPGVPRRRRRPAILKTSLRAAGSTVPAIPAESTYGGLGFDACQAPSAGTMAAWSASPFRAVGVYIGGLNSACSQPNLTAAWVSGEVAAGWHLIPTYVGLQGVGSCSGTCATITASQATPQGTEAAADAVTRAQALGLPAGNPIYDDMEQYSQSPANTTAVLAFLSGWTTQLHAAGYLSGVYSSASAAITDLVDANGTGYAEPDDIWFAHWNGEPTVTDPYIPSLDWAAQQRVHQFRGDHTDTYGGESLDIDSDYLGGATADTACVIPDGTFVQALGGTSVYELVGCAPLLVTSFIPFASPPPVQVISAQAFAALAPYPANGRFITAFGGASYRIAGGAPIAVDNPALFPGLVPGVTVDPWDLANIGSPGSGLLTAPVDGTIVEGAPSGTYWCFSGGIRTQVGPASSAVLVDDQGLAAFALGPPPAGPGCAGPAPQKVAPQCVVPRLKHMGLRRARRALHRARCRVGKVRRPRHWGRHHLLRVFGQSVRPGAARHANTKVNLRLL